MNAERTFAAIERAVALMNDHLGDSQVPPLDELASAACISKFHFLRIYQLVTGETCGETMQRLRLARAGQALAQGGTVTESAFIAGYGSSQALAKALRQTVGRTATDLQRSPERLAKTIEQLGTSQAPDGQHPLSIELASLDPFSIMAVRTEGTYPELAEVYIALADAIGGIENIRNIFGITMNNAEEGLGGDLVFDCGFEVGTMPESVPERVRQLAIDGGQFLVTRHQGCYSGLDETMDALYWSSLGDPRFQPADRPMFMHYLDDPETTPVDELRTDLYLPVIAWEHTT